jgi:hypothetical protein
MSILIDKLKHSNKTFTISNHNIVRLWIKANGCKLELSSRSITLFSLESQSLIKALGNINIRESPSITIVSPDMD